MPSLSPIVLPYAMSCAELWAEPICVGMVCLSSKMRYHRRLVCRLASSSGHYLIIYNMWYNEHPHGLDSFNSPDAWWLSCMKALCFRGNVLRLVSRCVSMPKRYGAYVVHKFLVRKPLVAMRIIRPIYVRCSLHCTAIANSSKVIFILPSVSYTWSSFAIPAEM